MIFMFFVIYFDIFAKSLSARKRLIQRNFYLFDYLLYEWVLNLLKIKIQMDLFQK